MDVPKSPGSQPQEDDVNFDELAALGSGTQLPDQPVVVAPPPRQLARVHRTAPAASAAPGWGSAIFDAIFSRNPAASQRQAVAQYWIFGLGFVLLGIAGSITFYLLEQRHGEFLARAKEVQAMVVTQPTISKPNKSGAFNPDRWDYNFPVRYSLDKQVFTCNLSVRGDRLPPELNRDDISSWKNVAIRVYYDPVNPAKAEAVSAAKAASWFWGYIVAGAFLAVGAWGLITKRPW